MGRIGRLALVLGACAIVLSTTWSVARVRQSGTAVEAGAPEPIAAAPDRTLGVVPSERRAVGSESMGRIRGTVTDTDGSPVPGAGSALFFEDDAGRRIVSGWDATGSFDARGLGFGAWNIRCEARGFASGSARVEVLPGTDGARADFVLRRERSVRLTLLDADGAPLADALLALGLPLALAPAVEVIEDGASRRFLSGSVFAKVEGGSVPAVEAARTRWVLRSGDDVLATIDVPENAKSVESRVDVVALRRRLATVRIGLTEPLERDARICATVGADFAFTLPVAAGARNASLLAPPGHLRLRLTTPGRAAERLELELEPGATLDLGPIALEPGYAVSGSVRDADGRPMGAPLELRRLARDGSWHAVERETARPADANGRFVLTDLAAGTWSVACAWGGPAVRFQVPCDAPVRVVGAWPDVSARVGSRPGIR